MKFTRTVLTSSVIDAAERMYQDITITAEQRQQIEHAAYVACMNEDTAAARLADFRRVLKIHHVSPEDIAPTETENAPQAATQAAEGTAQQADDITAAIIGAIGAPAPAHTITVSWANGTRATYSAAMLDMIRTDPAALDIQDDTTGELIYIKPDDAPAAEAEADPITAHPVPLHLAREYDARTYINRAICQRNRLPAWGSLCNSISWRYYHSAAHAAEM